jgi:hypothetical protein
MRYLDLRYIGTPAREDGMCDFTETERPYLTATRSLTRDDEGREVLVGLTDYESSLLMAYRRHFVTGHLDRDAQNLTVWLELVERHELARRVGTEGQADLVSLTSVEPA